MACHSIVVVHLLIVFSLKNAAASGTCLTVSGKPCVLPFASSASETWNRHDGCTIPKGGSIFVCPTNSDYPYLYNDNGTVASGTEECSADCPKTCEEHDHLVTCNLTCEAFDPLRYKERHCNGKCQPLAQACFSLVKKDLECMDQYVDCCGQQSQRLRLQQ